MLQLRHTYTFLHILHKSINPLFTSPIQTQSLAIKNK